MARNMPCEFASRALQALRRVREIELEDAVVVNPAAFYNVFPSVIVFLRHVCAAIDTRGARAESDAIAHVIDICATDPELGGLGLAEDASWAETSARTLDEVEFLIEAWLAAVSSAELARKPPEPLRQKHPGTRSMTLAEKIFAHHALTAPRDKGGVQAGDLVRVSIDWVIASEVTWVGMKKSMTSIGSAPRAWRNDRFWLAGDHVVDPRNYSQDRVKGFLQALQSAKHELKMTENQGLNYTILHTEFVRERAEPGMLVLGSDSHTCSAGAVSSLAIGLGAGDVMMGLATGQTWFKIPESIRIDFVGKPAWYIRGKDVILSILNKLKRNTHAADRIVEFGGPGARWLSCDARFAISNMCTELGAITGIFLPDEVTQAFVKRRKCKIYNSGSTYFLPDADACYAAKFEVDLGEVESFIAIYPSPDDVYPVADKLDMNMQFDGCFIGACTTTEEDLILAALVLRAGLKRGLPLAKGRRVVVPGSMPIVRNLRKLGLLDVYAAAGFEQPAPGCSLCLGIGADVAEEGSNWISSQNRNFKNRMGKGAVGHICSAATVAASSFSMTLTDPRELLQDVSEQEYNRCRETCRSWYTSANGSTAIEPVLEAAVPEYVEPNFLPNMPEPTDGDTVRLRTEASLPNNAAIGHISSRVYRMGDFVDTDAIIPAVFCTSTTDKQLGSHCFEFALPEFREKVRSGFQVVVAGKAFGCGSSREEAPRAMKGLGVQCIIAKSFSFIFGRNAPTIGLLAISITEDEFYHLARTGEEIRIDVEARSVYIAGKAFGFNLDEMELKLIENGGLPESFRSFGQDVFAALCRKRASVSLPALADMKLERESNAKREVLSW